MKILTYRELKSKDGLVPLLDHAFKWIYNSDQVEKSVKNDPKFQDSSMGFCAVEDERIISKQSFIALLFLPLAYQC
jgi:hypothetical protein